MHHTIILRDANRQANRHQLHLCFVVDVECGEQLLDGILVIPPNRIQFVDIQQRASAQFDACSIRII